MSVTLAHTHICETPLEIQMFHSEGAKEEWDCSGGFKVTACNPVTHKLYMFVFEITEGRSCCENYGFIDAPAEDFLYHKDALLHRIEVFEVENRAEYDEGGAVFINLHTSKGVLTLTVYNSHNGWYRHSVELYRKDLATGESAKLYATSI